MINKKYVILCAVSAFVGLLLFAYQKEYLIINFSPTNHASVTNSMMEKKNITLHYWHQNKWNTEQVSLLFSENNAANMQQLVSRWLQLINEEEISKKKVQLQSAAITYDTQELIISFDRTPWNKEISTFEKWMTGPISEYLGRVGHLIGPLLAHVGHCLGHFF